MPRLNLAATHERRLQVTEETRRLLIAHDVQTPNYFPIIALIEMQKHVGYKPNSNTRTRRRQNPFSSTEMPRTIEGRITTPSWLRYANIDGQNQYYAAVLPGYHWDVEYYRCEDGSLITYPALAKLPELPVAPEKVKVELSDVTRSMEVEAELTDEGIEDISSDEELYARGDHMSEDIEDDESGESDEEMVEVAPTAGLLAGDIRPIRSRADSSVSAASHVSEGAPTPAFSDRRPSVMGNTRRYEGIKQMSIPRDQAPGKRVDSRHASMVENSDRDDEDEAMSCGVDEHSDEDHGVGAGSGGEDDGDGVLDEDEEEVDGEVDDGALDDDEHDEDWR